MTKKELLDENDELRETLTRMRDELDDILDDGAEETEEEED